MPYVNSFNVNDSLQEEVIRVKRLNLTPNQVSVGIGIQKTIEPKRPVAMDDWYAHIKRMLRCSLKKKISLANLKNL